MTPSGYFGEYFATLDRKLRSADTASLEAAANLLAEVRRADRKVIIAGNGGSAAIASHVSVDLTKTCGIRAVTFNEVDLITCFANDYGYENWVAKALEAYARPGDLALLISSGGRSPNMVNAAHRARALGMRILTLTGFDSTNPLRGLGDINLWVDSAAYNVVEITHQSWLLAVVDYLGQASQLPS